MNEEKEPYDNGRTRSAPPGTRNGEPRLPDATTALTLPVGFYENGTYYRDVIVDEFTGVDEELVSKPSFRSDPTQAVEHLLRRLIQAVPGLMDQKPQRFGLAPATLVSRMFVPDYNYVVLCCAIISFGSTYEHNWKCPNCQKVNDQEVDMARIPVYDWKGDAPAFSFDDGQNRGTIRLPTFKDQRTVSKRGAGAAEQATAMLGQVVQDFNGDKSLVTEDFRRMPSSKRRVLASVMEDALPGPDLAIPVVCAYCGEQAFEQTDPAAFFGRSSRR
jgi:hypothetical protein